MGRGEVDVDVLDFEIEVPFSRVKCCILPAITKM